MPYYRLAQRYALPSLFVMLILNGTFRGLGDTVRPFWVSLGANAIHALTEAAPLALPGAERRESIWPAVSS